MAGNKKNKPRKPSSPNTPPQSTDGGSTGRVGQYAISSGGGLTNFFKSPFFPTFASVFIVLMAVAVWLRYRPRLVTVALAVMVLALVLGVIWLASRFRKRSGALLLNETHDRHDYPKQEEFGSLITHTQPSQTSASSEEAPSAEFGNLREAFKALNDKVKDIDARLAELERERYYSTSPKPMDERRPAAAAPASPPTRRPAPAYNTYEEPRSHPPPIDLTNLNQAVCRFLVEESGSWEIDRLVQSVQRSSDGSAPIKVEHLGPYSPGEWRLVALWPQSSREGLVLVSSGELVDDEIAKYFDVGFGRRIIACKQPASVSRSGDEVTVLQKGRVESS